MKEYKMSSEGRWRPSVGDTYWYLSVLGEVCETKCDNETDKSLDCMFWKHGNCFKTCDEAAVAAARVHAVLVASHSIDKDGCIMSANRKLAEHYMSTIDRNGHEFGVNLITHLCNLIDISDSTAAASAEKLKQIKQFVNTTIGESDDE